MAFETFGYLSEEDRRQAIELAYHVAKGDWVLFVGSGVSRSSGLPLWRGLAQMMTERLGLESEARDPIRIATHFETSHGRQALAAFLEETLNTFGLNPAPLHDRLLTLCPRAIVTTNVEDMLEQAIMGRRIPYKAVVTDQELTIIDDRLLVLKLHGDLGKLNSFVFTQTDYDRYPRHELVNNELLSLAAKYSFLFVGYSATDPNLERQFRKVLDAQGEMARFHYLVIDEIPDSQRQELLRRKIRTISIGSYGQLIQFLEDLQAEALRLPKRTEAWSLSGMGALEPLKPGADDETLIKLFEEDYAPVIEALNHFRLVEAEEYLQRILKRIKLVEADPIKASMPGLKDLHQRALLVLGTIAVRRKNRNNALSFLHKAEELKPFGGRRRLQAAELLINLEEFQQAQALLVGTPEENEAKGKELLAFAALLQDDEARFRELLPEGGEESPDLLIQQARLAVERLEPAGIGEAIRLLDKAWKLTENYPLALMFIAGLIDQLFRRIISEAWDVPHIDRHDLLREIRNRHQKAREAFEALEDQYPEGFTAALAQQLDFHRFLGEEEAQQAILERLRSLPILSRERVLAEHLAKAEVPELSTIESLFQQGHLSLGERAMLVGQALVQAGKNNEAEQVYRLALAGPLRQEERRSITEALLQLLLEGKRFAEAMALMEGLPATEKLFRQVMKGLICLYQKDKQGALSILRATLCEHPRSRALLQNLVYLLSEPSRIDESDAEEGQPIPDLEEALGYAERLEALIPSPEHTLLRADLLRRLGRFEEALSLVEKVDQDGYCTLRSFELKVRLLGDLGQYRDAAKALAARPSRFRDDYLLQFNEAIIWTKCGELDRAIAIWDDLRKHPKADGNLYINLGNIYISRKAADPESFNKAFEFFKEALTKFPDRPEFPALLIQAAEGSGRGREAWEIIGMLDLRGNPYLRTVSAEEGLKLHRRMEEVLRHRTRLYQAGLLPFSIYTTHSPRPSAFLWQARVHCWREGSRSTPILCGFPYSSVEMKRPGLPSAGVLLDMTALLTLGVLEATREVLQALHQGGSPSFLFSGARRWLESEIINLGLAQMPYYRECRRRLRDRLRAARDRVEIPPFPENGERPLGQEARQRLGSFAQDVELAVARGVPYLDDYLSPEEQAVLPEGLVIHSSDLLAALEQTGLILPETARSLREVHPDPFSNRGTGVEIALDRPVMFSGSVLQMWHDAGLLEGWLGGEPGWPPKILVGPFAWSLLDREVTEEEIYQEAFELARNLRSAIEEAFEAGWIREMPESKAPDLGGDAQIREIFSPALALLAQAREHGLALWGDDLFIRLLPDRRGLLASGSDAMTVDFVARARHAFSGVVTVGTEDVLCWLESNGHLRRERRLDCLWRLHERGYRFLDVSEVLPWLLQRFQYNFQAYPIARLLGDLESGLQLAPSGVDPHRFRLFLATYLSGVFARAIIAIWYLEGPEFTLETRRAI